ncbi:YagK/YfjJ domain-containing protein [Enterobacter roggenkampii]|uniref:YagK/YfjJ domain-containing protein n=1 Tax=Enterobacter roggenkampii TaxID=1812935 RepID=UPI0007510C98|nr:inovirus-type Gp2 protein [Enterobacter roggenkampii]KUR08629.1 hypothetical protein AWI34_03925 [Enterobacter roggenkampii]
MINSKTASKDPILQCAVINNITRSSAYPDIKAGGEFLYDNVLWPVMPEESQQNIKIMNSLFRAIDKTYRCCSRFLAIRYDFHLPQYSPDNRVITDFHKLLIPALRKLYPKSFMRFFWVREQNKAPAQHYHYLLMMDGNAVRHPHKINQLVKCYWKHATDGRVWLPKHGYYLVTRDDTEALTALLLRVSYFAKRYSKTHIADGIGLSGTQHYSCLKKARRIKPAQLQINPAASVPAQKHCPLPGKLDPLFAEKESQFPGEQIEYETPEDLFKYVTTPVDIKALRSKALLRALRRLHTHKKNDSITTLPGSINSSLTPHWLRHFERYYLEYWPCNISVRQYCHWYYLNPGTAGRYLYNYPASLINPWLLKAWL